MLDILFIPVHAHRNGTVPRAPQLPPFENCFARMDDIQPGKFPSCVFSAIFTELLPRYLSFSARAVVALRNNLVVEHRASSRWNEERGGMSRMERGKRWLGG